MHFQHRNRIRIRQLPTNPDSSMLSRTWGNSFLAAPIVRYRELCRLGSGRLASSFPLLVSVWISKNTHRAHQFELIGASLYVLQGKGLYTYGQVRFRRA